MGLRVMLKRPGPSGIWLDRDAPAVKVKPTQTLNGSGAVEFDVPADYVRSKGEDGLDLISEWCTEVMVESETGAPMQAGIVDDIKPGATFTTVSAGGLSMAPNGVPWDAPEKRYLNADPAQVMRDIWAHTQAQPLGDLGVTVTGETTATVGTLESTAYTTAKSTLAARTKDATKAATTLKARTRARTTAWQNLATACKWSSVTKVIKSKYQPLATARTIWVNGSTVKITKGTKWVAAPSGVATAYTAWKTATAAVTKAKATKAEAAASLKAAKAVLKSVENQAEEALVLSWWETTDLGQVIGELDDSGMDWREVSTFSGDDLVHRIECRDKKDAPRRDGLRFELGVNVHTAPDITPAEVYTEVRVLGAGEGSKKIRETVTWSVPAATRRVKTITDTDLKTKTRVQARARTEATKAKKATSPTIESMTVIDHEYARWTEYDVGDVIHIVGTMPGGWNLDTWARVTERTFDGTTDRAELKLEEETTE